MRNVYFTIPGRFHVIFVRFCRVQNARVFGGVKAHVQSARYHKLPIGRIFSGINVYKIILDE